MMQAAAYGRLGTDPKSIATQSGKAMVVATMAVSLQAGRDAEATEWIGLVCFGKVAEILQTHEKGTMLSVAGRVQVNEYESKGEKKRQLQIICDSIISAKSVRPKTGMKKSQPGTDAGAPFDDPIDF